MTSTKMSLTRLFLAEHLQILHLLMNSLKKNTKKLNFYKNQTMLNSFIILSAIPILRRKKKKKSAIPYALKMHLIANIIFNY